MTFKELCDWVKNTKNLESQTVLALQEEDEPDATLEVGKVCYLPFVAQSFPDHTIKGKFCEASSRLYIELWDDLNPYTWGDFVKWIGGLADSNVEATALAAWHLCKLKILKNDVLYAYEEG